MKELQLFITPQEAVKLSHQLTTEHWKIAKDIQEAYCEDRNKVSADDTLKTCFSLAAIFNAGRVQGIREERQKRRLSKSKRKYINKKLQSLSADMQSSSKHKTV